MIVMRFLLSALLAIVPGTAFAQTAADQNDIVIRDRALPDRKAAEAYVANISLRSDGQLARFHQPVCPSVVGLPAEHAAIVERRILADATAAKAPVTKKLPCTPNLIVIIATSGRDLVSDMKTSRPGWLTGLSIADIDALTAEGPARAWSITSLRNEDGEGIGQPRGSSQRDPLGDAPAFRVRSASIVRQPNRQDVEASFVVIDRAATVGLSLRQVADYAAMRGLAHTRPPASGGPVDTILSVLDGAATRPRELTASDSAYLRALYARDGLDSAVAERNAIARRIAKGK
ncbi:MAG: hypothetical protein E7773_11895 [Sphingomonas sp.]|uniref:hypothetical protein n=1 Tax=Sphingomonas sp. TaxID=28214 RepID=UPI0011F95225|nr:hypothetical protein [Sphingomonas sp.]THD35149.1 MAG: hypothetical protein E7773_11895 [Sphingomonas sp.]